MIALDELIVALLGSVPLERGGAADGVRVAIDEVAMTLPVEVRFGARPGIEASAPRGRYGTGFDLPHHLLSVTFTAGGEP